MKFKKGDIIKMDGLKYSILIALEGIYLLSWDDNFDEINGWYTEKQLEYYTLVSSAPWKPEEDEKYFCVYSDGDIGLSFWDATSIDLYKKSTGNVHKTKEEAEAYKQRLIKAHRDGII